MKLGARIRSAVKAFSSMIFSGRSGWSWLSQPRSRFDYGQQVGDGRGSSIVQACVLWACRTFPEAPVRLRKPAQKGKMEAVGAHPLVELLARPNRAYSGVLLWWATIADFLVSGNAYWIKVPSKGGRVVELWWVPHLMLEPKWPDDGSAYLSHYDYRPNPNLAPIRLEVGEVIHFRHGIDPQNTRKGLSPLQSLLREIFTDDEAANFSASLLRNLGVPGVVVSPGDDYELQEGDAEAMKVRFKEKFGGDNRGEPLVLSGKMDVKVVSFSPQQLDLKVLRRLPEERVSAVIGVPAVVAGLGAGLDHSTYSNMEQAREAAWEQCLVPMQRLLSEELNTQLLPDFADPASGFVLDFDHSKVKALVEDATKSHNRIKEQVLAGIITPNEARADLGLERLDGADVLYVPINVSPTAPADLLVPAPAPVVALPAAGSGPRALPPAASAPKALKAAGDGLVGSYARLRARLQRGLESKLAAHLAAWAERAAASLGAKAVVPLGDEEAEAAALASILEASYRGVLLATDQLAQDALGLSWELDDPATRAYLNEAGSQIRGIAQTTLQAVRDALTAGHAAHETVDELAARIRALPEFGRARARMIARTELARASNLSAATSYAASGVVSSVLVHDGDSDAECMAANGQTWALEYAQANPLQHPACVRAFAPLVGVAGEAAA